MSNALIPTGAEISAMEAICEKAVESGLLPVAYKNNPAAAFLAVQMGRELGIQPLMSLRNINVIQGKPEFSAALIAGLMQSAGVSWQVNQRDNECASANFERGKTTAVVQFTADDAKQAGLGGDNYQKYTADMLWARMISRAGKIMAPDVLAGCYVTGEISGAINGNVASLHTAPPQRQVKAAEVLSVTREPVSDKTPGKSFVEEKSEKVIAHRDANESKLSGKGISGPQVKLVQMTFKAANVDDAARKKFLKYAYRVDSVNDLTKHQATKVINRISEPNAGAALYEFVENEEAKESEERYKRMGEKVGDELPQGGNDDDIPF